MAGSVKGGAIRLEKLVKSFDGVPAVTGIDLDIPAGQFYSLLGASGCGKTTTLRMIAGFEKPDSGRIELDGRDVAGDPPHKRPVNTVFQTYALFPFMSVWDNVAFGLKYQKASRDETKRRVGEALELVRMSDFSKRRPAQLSGGQQQRVALARALVLRPTRPSARRAAGCAGREATQTTAAGASRGAARGRDHVRVRDPRSRGSADHERPDRRAGGGSRRTGRPAAGDLLRACHHVRRRIPRRRQHFRRRCARGRRRIGGVLGAGHPARRRGRRIDRNPGAAAIVIRPERITLQSPGEPIGPGCNVIGGTVSQVVYLGNCTQVHVDVGAPTALIVEVANHAGPGLGDP